MQLIRPAKIWMALGVCYFGSLIWAAHFFPRPYDWRRDVISSLASPRDNPHAYGIACSGLAVSGLLLIGLIGGLQQRLGPDASGWSGWAGKLFLVGAVFLILSALVVPGHYRVLGVGRSHEHLAQISGVAFCLSLLLYLGVVLRLPRTPPWFRCIAIVLVIIPVTALVTSRLSLVFAYELLSSTTYQLVKHSLWNSVALWEWVGAACIYLFLGLMLWLPPHSDSMGRT
jgi:hypothetical protein